MRYLAAISLSLTSLAVAQSTAPAADNEGPHVEFGIDFTTQYFFRGIQQENQGIIAQPRIALGYDVYDGEPAGLHDVGLTFGVWNSLHDGPTGGARGIWFENDFYVGLRGKVGDRWTVGTTYTSYYSPNNSFTGVQEIAFSLGLDDKEMWLPAIASGLQPSAMVAFEVDGQADAGAPGHLGVYGQLAIAPAFPLGQLGQLDLTLTTPVTLGLSLRNYYELAGDDDVFGFFDVGAVVSSALPFVSHRFGPWSADLGLHWLLLGDHNKTRNQGDATELILSLGFTTKF